MSGASADGLPSWRETTAKQSIAEFVAAVTDRDSPDFVTERDRIAVFDNDGTLWTEQPVYAQLVFALDRAAELGHPTSLEELHAGGMAALIKLLALTHAGITTDEFDAVCRSWLASARHPRFGRPYPATVYQPMLELLGLLDRNGFSCWIFSGGGTDFMRTWTADVYDHRAARAVSPAAGDARAVPGALASGESGRRRSGSVPSSRQPPVAGWPLVCRPFMCHSLASQIGRG